MARGFTRRMFPHRADLIARDYPRGASGAPTPHDGAAVSVPCGIQLAGDDKLRALYPDEGDEPGDEKTLNVTFPVPGTAWLSAQQSAAIAGFGAQDTLEPTAPAAYVGLTLIAVGPALPVARGAAVRARFKALT